MNTRLQVEHPVTELVSGLDLVELAAADRRRRAAAVRRRTRSTARGHAIEARVYAEDPAAGFLPQAGTATTVRWSGRARVDAALEPGQRVDTWYDPLLGKVIAHGATREAARRALVAALDDSAIFGVTTNLGFLRRLAAADEFRDAAIDTGWLDRNPGAFPAEPSALALIAAAWSQATLGGDDTPFGAGDGWRLGGPPAPVAVELEHAGERHVVRVDVAAGRVGDSSARPVASEPGRLRLEIDGAIEEFQVEPEPHGVTVGHHGEAHVFRRPAAFEHDAAATADGSLLAPMPGTVLSVATTTGAPVRQGDQLVVIEAMKMELSLTAPFDGAVASLHVAPGDQVKLGQVLAEVEPVA